MNLFKVVILGIFGLFTVVAVLIFAGIIPLGKGDPSTTVKGEVTLWGTIPRDMLRGPLEIFHRDNSGSFSVDYVEKREEVFDRDLVEALASGVGPDMIFLPQDLILRHNNKIFPIPYESMSARDFQNSFIEEGELYLRDEGIISLPFSIDPLVMYWNRDIFSGAGIVRPPETWDELFTLTPQLTRSDETLNILRSAVSLGEYRNIDHAKDIISLLMMQAGTPIVTMNKLGEPKSVLGESFSTLTPPAQSAVRFYTEFSNSAKSFYSWNRSLPQAKDLFIAGDLAIYFGYASEHLDIQAKSPNLNFDVAVIPQTLDADRKTTFGRVMGVSVLKSSKNIQTAFFASFLLTGTDFIRLFTDENQLPPVRRDLLEAKPDRASSEVFNNSALISRGWLDPNPQETDTIFRNMIENIVSGQRRLSEAVSRADSELQELLK